MNSDDYPDKKISPAVKEMRRWYHQMIPLAGTPDEVFKIQNLTIPAGNPQREIPIRIYYPLKGNCVDELALPIFFFAHGGGFVSGNLNTHDIMLRAISNGAECIVISVDYRLAPEHPFPAALDDCLSVLQWIKEYVSILGGDINRIVIGGDSAGGNLATSLAILNRDKKYAQLIGQWLMYPTLSNKMDTESWDRYGDKYFPTNEDNKMFITAYVPEGQSPYAPLIAPMWANHENLPPTLLQAGGLDTLCDDSRNYALSLQQSDVEATLIIYMNSEHGFLQFYKNEKLYPNAVLALEHGLSWLRNIFYTRKQK